MPASGRHWLFYSIFSLGPVIVIAIAIAGLVFGTDAVQTQVIYVAKPDRQVWNAGHRRHAQWGWPAARRKDCDRHRGGCFSPAMAAPPAAGTSPPLLD